MTAPLRIRESIADFAFLLSALAKPFAVAADILSYHHISPEELAFAKTHWAPVLREDLSARRAFSSAFGGGVRPQVRPASAPGSGIDETVVLKGGSPAAASMALPFVKGEFRPPPTTPAASKARDDGDDATQVGAASTDITLPFLRSSLRRGAK